MAKAIVLLSGGLDSTICAGIAAKEHDPENIIGLSIDYGQKHAVELDSARDVVANLKIGSHIIESFPNIFGGYGSTLIDQERDNPEMTYEEIQRIQGPSPTYVPFRNGNLLSMATAIALVEGAEWIYYGAHAEDARNFAYPDTTHEFNGAMANAIFIGTYYKVRLVTPLQWLTKKDVVKLGFELGVPFHLTYSCYTGRRPSCGKCPTCISRIQAFKTIGIPDPIPYEVPIDWRI
jgi:7-cyano-7-deazaguanine synthase